MEQISAKVSRTSERIVQYTLVGMVAIMTVIIILQVFMRYLFLYSLSWSEEVARYLMIWVSFLGASLALKYGFHIGVEFVINRVPEKMRGWANLMAKLGMLLSDLFHHRRFSGVLGCPRPRLPCPAFLNGLCVLISPCGWAFHDHSIIKLAG
jgi:TRAP-type mannitol/chloroaromatic compound transport system permease small subunit